MKKPAAGKKAAPAPAKKKTAAKTVKVAPKKPVAKKPPPGLTGPALAAHKAHLAHLAHLQHLGLRPAPAPVHHRRQLALGEGVACCAAEALAASLRLSGRRADDSDVLALYRRTASAPDTGASILATLEAAAEFGLAGVRLANFRRTTTSPSSCSSLILGLELPGSHAVLAAPDGWWSWGDLHDPTGWPDAVIEEAWAVTWE